MLLLLPRLPPLLFLLLLHLLEFPREFRHRSSRGQGRRDQVVEELGITSELPVVQLVSEGPLGVAREFGQHVRDVGWAGELKVSSGVGTGRAIEALEVRRDRLHVEVELEVVRVDLQEVREGVEVGEGGIRRLLHLDVVRRARDGADHGVAAVHLERLLLDVDVVRVTGRPLEAPREAAHVWRVGPDR